MGSLALVDIITVWFGGQQDNSTVIQKLYSEIVGAKGDLITKLAELKQL